MKRNKKIFLIASLTIVIIIFFGVVLAHAVFFVPADDITIPSSLIPTTEAAEEPLVSQNLNLINKDVAQITYPAAYPKQLRIPLIKVNAKIQYVGVAKNNKMATPNNFTDVGWFQNGIVPGEKGSAVIDGHVDNGLAFPAVFADLYKLSVGDDVYVDTIGGSTLHFKIINIKNYDAGAQTVEIFKQNDSNYLKLITCAGQWSILHRTHDQRLVITAEQIL